MLKKIVLIALCSSFGFGQLAAQALQQVPQEGFIEGGPEEARSKTLRTLLKQHVCFKANEPVNALRPEYERAVGPKLKVVKEKIQAFSTKANIVVPDLKGDNGMVHVIDAILDTEPDEKL